MRAMRMPRRGRVAVKLLKVLAVLDEECVQP